VNIVSGLITAGLRLEWLHEHDSIPWQMFGCQVRDSYRRDGDLSPPTGSRKAVTHPPFPQNPACRFPAPGLRQLLHSTAVRSSQRPAILRPCALSCAWRPRRCLCGRHASAGTPRPGNTLENILGRITFHDVESRPMQRDLTDHEKRRYLREIKRDIAYFNRSFCRADLSVDISGSSLDDASRRVWGALNPTSKERSNAWNIALL